ncbi:GATOR complex protein DEPDC5 isoform X1 [Trichogramma pretiosum]|uniref:GATOR complex protein DEPDC5 isoform X1 n=1 Tax=Trichogramma pretiosum TaxID=7493 RepID=UPI0006C95FE2|nr:GATOR complex protein DEPDC5 isoform X1 [Trichogramma pretiosum]
MKLFKLIVHQKNFSGEDLIINPKDYPGIKTGDVVEIYDPDDIFSRLLLQVTAFKEDLQTRETISVESTVASMFQLRTYGDVYMNIVDPAKVALDSVELTFKDQYMGRSEMWRLKNSLVNTCVYMNKKIEFCGGSIRCQVYEMWLQGDRVACGVITDDTKVVFRSSTSMVYLFIQMSSEMWDFDIHGDLYFEKAVNGFLADLFQKWKKNGSNHEVTIVLFSRTFYNATSLEEFPNYMRECLQQDYRGRFYEDFYRVAVQNERYDDWSNVLVQLRKLFTDYQKLVLEYHQKPGIEMPAATNSTAAQGNFLEVLNMSLNVFEKHYLDRSFDRTGQLSVVITPGVGVFEVDRELTNVTKQRIIDNGVGSDLVCVGEQPLHAVPLLKFHNKDSSINVPDDYSMPHWINLSFYSTNKKIPNSTFIPRIKLPQRVTKQCSENNGIGINLKEKARMLQEETRDCLHNTFFDYDAYDAQVFQLPLAHATSLHRTNGRTKKTSVICMETHNNAQALNLLKRKMSDPDIHHPPPEVHSPPLPIVPSTTSGNSSRSAAISIPSRNDNVTSNGSTSETTAPSRSSTTKSELTDTEISPPLRPIIGSAGNQPKINGSLNSHLPQTSFSAVRPSRALINPFDPSHVTIKLTSNRRRWTHIFPKGPTGVLIQQHHYQAIPANPQQQKLSENNNADALSTSPNEHHVISQSYSTSISRSASQSCFNESMRGKMQRMNLTLSNGIDKRTTEPKSLTLLWGATGEQEWTPALTTAIIGVDWKSLTISACLPITTDYFPDKRSLQNDYVVSDYNLLPDDVNADFAQQRAIYRKPLSTAEVFRELVSQRLAQGFQLIILPPGKTQITTPGSNSIPTISSVMRGRHQADSEHKEEYLLSIGRIFHKISLCGNSISVTRYRPRHPYPPFNIHYRYRFHAPHHDTYEVSWVSFTTEKLENYNWNYLDHYICTRGDTDFALVEALKYWRFRVFLLPLHNQATRKILEGSPHCDIYTPLTTTEQIAMMEGFLRFTEGWLNKIRRPHPNKNWSPTALLAGVVPRDPASHLTRRRHSTSLVSLTNQETLKSVVLGASTGTRTALDTPRHVPLTRSGSKVMDRGRVSPASEAAQSASQDQQQQLQQQQQQAQSQLEHLEINDENFSPEMTKIKSNAPLPEILEAMRHPSNGIGFLTSHPSLPSQTFVSADAVQWLSNHIEGGITVETACSIMKGMIQEKLICHASGDFSKQFIVGFYLYHIVQDKDHQKDYLPPLGDLQSFENEWIEVETRVPKGWCEPQSSHSSTGHLSTSSNSTVSHPISIPSSDTIDESDVHVFLRNDLGDSADPDERDFAQPMYKHTHLDIDINNKSDRVEWGHLRYQSAFKPDHSYELVVQWVAASGSIVADLVFNWQRKAQSCGIQMIPIPSDLLALPFTAKSDPLRGPIFIPLDTECLMAGKRYLFEEFREDSYAQRLFLFQGTILQRFGFLRCLVEGNENAHQYVHCTGNAFVLVPSTISPRPRQPTGSNITRRSGVQHRYPVHADQPSPHEAYITRHVSGKNKDDYSMDRRMGFLWSWNHMLSRKWKIPSTATGDELFQKKIIQDFRHFCSNGDNRLKRFWDSCWESKEKFCTNAK